MSDSSSPSAFVLDTFPDRLNDTRRFLDREGYDVDAMALPPRFKPEDPDAFPDGILPEVFAQMRDSLHARLTAAIASSTPPSVVVANYVAFTSWGIAELMVGLALSGAVPPIVVISCLADDLLARCAAKWIVLPENMTIVAYDDDRPLKFLGKLENALPTDDARYVPAAE